MGTILQVATEQGSSTEALAARVMWASFLSLCFADLKRGSSDAWHYLNSEPFSELCSYLNLAVQPLQAKAKAIWKEARYSKKYESDVPTKYGRIVTPTRRKSNGNAGL